MGDIPKSDADDRNDCENLPGDYPDRNSTKTDIRNIVYIICNDETDEPIAKQIKLDLNSEETLADASVQIVQNKSMKVGNIHESYSPASVKHLMSTSEADKKSIHQIKEIVVIPSPIDDTDQLDESFLLQEASNSGLTTIDDDMNQNLLPGDSEHTVLLDDLLKDFPSFLCGSCAFLAGLITGLLKLENIYSQLAAISLIEYAKLKRLPKILTAAARLDSVYLADADNAASASKGNFHLPLDETVSSVQEATSFSAASLYEEDLQEISLSKQNKLTDNILSDRSFTVDVINLKNISNNTLSNKSADLTAFQFIPESNSEKIPDMSYSSVSLVKLKECESNLEYLTGLLGPTKMNATLVGVGETFASLNFPAWFNDILSVLTEDILPSRISSNVDILGVFSSVIDTILTIAFPLGLSAAPETDPDGLSDWCINFNESLNRISTALVNAYVGLQSDHDIKRVRNGISERSAFMSFSDTEEKPLGQNELMKNFEAQNYECRVSGLVTDNKHLEWNSVKDTDDREAYQTKPIKDLRGADMNDTIVLKTDSIEMRDTPESLVETNDGIPMARSIESNATSTQKMLLDDNYKKTLAQTDALVSAACFNGLDNVTSNSFRNHSVLIGANGPNLTNGMDSSEVDQENKIIEFIKVKEECCLPEITGNKMEMKDNISNKSNGDLYLVGEIPVFSEDINEGIQGKDIKDEENA